MKILRAISSLLVVAACFAWVMCSCVTETTRTITTDKAGTVTEVTTTKKGTDPAALALVSVATEIYLPRRPLIIREEKADHDMRRLLRGWRGPGALAATGPVTAEEIGRRWKPAVDTRAGE